MTIQDLCREQRKKLGLSAQEIADRSGVPLSTVNNFFAAASKSPTLATAGAICAVLGVSLDAFYGVVPAPSPEDETLEERLLHEQEKNAILERSLLISRRVVLALFIVMILALIYGITIDILNPHMGLFQY